MTLCVFQETQVIIVGNENLQTENPAFELTTESFCIKKAIIILAAYTFETFWQADQRSRI